MFRIRLLQTGVILGLVVVIVSLLSLVAVWSLTSALQEQVGTSLAQKARLAADRLDQFLWSRKGEIAAYSRLDLFTQRASLPQVRRELDRFQAALPVFSWMGLTDAEGTVLASTGGILQGESITARPVFLEAREAPFLGDVHDAVLLAKLLPNPTGEPMRFVDVSFPVTDDQGRFRGVLATHISWAWIQEIRKEFLAEASSTGGDLLVSSAADQVYIIGPAPLLGTEIPEAFHGATHPGSVVLGAGEDRAIYGFARARGYQDFPGFGWLVIVKEPLSTAFRGLSAQQTALWSTGFLAAVLFSLLGWFLGKGLSQPLTRLSHQSEVLRQGEHHLQLPRSRIAEIQQLSDSLQHLASGLAAMTNLAVNDPLTGLSNRLGTDEWLRRVVPLAEREGWGLVLLALDLDHFKPVNDTHGHDAGDAVLCWAAENLKAAVRGDEMVARWGGDEFAVVLLIRREAPSTAAAEIAQRILEKFRKPFVWKEHPCAIGCSIGGAFWNRAEGMAWSEAQRRADEALYSAKRAGRNRFAWKG